jgi:hypothetical protein
MKMRHVYEYHDAPGKWRGGGEPEKMPDHEEGIHDHLSSRFEGRIYRGEGTPVDMVNPTAEKIGVKGVSDKVNLRAASKTTSMFETDNFKKAAQHLRKNGWTGGPEGSWRDASHVYNHPEYKHTVVFEAGWSGQHEMTVLKPGEERY